MLKKQDLRMFSRLFSISFWRNYRAVRKSRLVDAGFYWNQFVGRRRLKVDASFHYMLIGWRENRNPNALFDTGWYLTTNPEVGKTRLDPVSHYLKIGAQEGRDPSSRFDSTWYLERFADVKSAGLNPLGHYLRWGRAENRSATPFRFGISRPLNSFEAWQSVNAFSDRDRSDLLRRLEANAGKLPTISVVMPIFNTDTQLLKEAIQSVLAQIFQDWQLVLIDDGSDATDTIAVLQSIANTDERIKVDRLSRNSGISEATNRGVELADCEVIVFLDHDDLITPDCLAEIVLCYAENPSADIVYSDDDKVDRNGCRFAPQFKPDWSPTLLLSWMYLGHVLSVRKALFERTGGFRAEFDGSQDYDFALRATESARKICHIPKILYHWRAVEGSTAVSGLAKPDSIARGARAVEDALKRRGAQRFQVTHPAYARSAGLGMYDVIFPHTGPSVTLIISAVNDQRQLQRLLREIWRTDYQNFEVVVGVREELREWDPGSETLNGKPIRFDCAEGPSPAVLNDIVASTGTDYLLFLDGSVTPAEPSWLSQMIGYATLANAAVVGAKIVEETDVIHSAGVVTNLVEGLPGAAFEGRHAEALGYLGLLRNSRECSAVDDACLLTPRSIFLELGGFDQRGFSRSQAAIDYCLRLMDTGRHAVVCASAKLRRHAAQDTKVGTLDGSVEFRRRYGNKVDRWYNRNLAREVGGYEIVASRPETTRTEPVRVTIFTHNLNHEGAPTTLKDLINGLTRDHAIHPTLISPVDGPLRTEFEEFGVQTLVRPDLIQCNEIGSLNLVSEFLKSIGAEVVLANTLRNFWAVAAAKEARIPSIWAQHESEPWNSYFDDLGEDARAIAYKAFAYPYKIVYVAEATRAAWRPMETHGNFTLIRHGIPQTILDSGLRRWTKESARAALEIPIDATVVLSFGTVCRRKGQMDLARAYLNLPAETRGNVYVLIVGRHSEPDYVAEIRSLVSSVGTNVKLIGEVDDPYLYYAASDVFACTSFVESAPRTLLEAMAAGLPIVTTPVFGIPELVGEGDNALFYRPGEVNELARALLQLIKDDALRAAFATNSPKVLQSQPGYAEMVAEYRTIIREAVNLQVH